MDPKPLHHHHVVTINYFRRALPPIADSYSLLRSCKQSKSLSRSGDVDKPVHTGTMSTLEDLDDLERDEKEQQKKSQDDKQKADRERDPRDADMKDTDAEKEEDGYIDMEILQSSTRDIINRRRLLENEMKILKSEFQRLTHEQNTMKEKIKDNLDKIENNRFVGPWPPCLEVVY